MSQHFFWHDAMTRPTWKQESTVLSEIQKKKHFSWKHFCPVPTTITGGENMSYECVEDTAGTRTSLWKSRQKESAAGYKRGGRER